MNQETKTNKTGFTTKSITMMALFAAILCISAYISIPLSQSFITILVWMALGAIGLPVFIGGGSGIGYLTNIFGGYTFSFLVIAIVLPLIRGKKYNRILYTVAAIVGVVLIDIIGMLFWKVNAGLSWKVAFLSGFVAFIPLDLVKAVIAAQIIPAFRKVMQSAE